MSAAPPPPILFVTSECVPYSKTGGLADVSAALPAALSRLGADVRVLLPAYGAAPAGARAVATLPAAGNFPAATIVEAAAAQGATAWLVVCPPFYARNGGPYQSTAGADWPDNALRFGFLGRIAALAASGAIPGWRPRVIHCNDWQSAMAAAYVRFMPSAQAATVFTIHNLAFQGIFPREVVAALGLPPESFSIEGLEFYGKCSFMKAGLFYSDAITTVSPTYAREIQTAEFGCGLAGLLARRSADLTGILNGIDTLAWNPASDANLARRYGAATLADKLHNKRALQIRAGLPPHHQPLIGVVTRLTEQKGVDWIIDIAPQLAAKSVQLVVLGNGEPQYERALSALAAAHPANIAVTLGFDEAYAHLIEGGADMFMMPSRFEPCGMNQMYSQRYGTVPIVRATGGLADSVVDAAQPDGSGFVFAEANAAALLRAVERALAAYRDRATWRRLQQNGMRREFGWRASALGYLEIYRQVAQRRQLATPSA